MFSRSYRLGFVSLVLLICVLAAPLLAPPTQAVSLPIHCSDLLDGDCDRPLLCLAICFMELAGLYDFCERFPNDPRCM